MQEAGYRNTVSRLINERPLYLILFLFLISVAVRIPNLNRPLSKHHELNAALVLITAEEWNNKGAAFYNYVPVHSYHYPGDDIFSENGKIVRSHLVNVSFGTLWYIMPYYFFRILQAQPSPLLLQVFNLILHFITILLLYRLIRLLLVNHQSAKVKAVAAVAIYLFSPTPMWFHGNGYVHEVAVLPFVFGACILYLNILRNKKNNLHNYLLLTLLVIAGTCCDWFMCFVAFAMFINNLVQFFLAKEKRHIYLSIALALGVVSGITITVLQFSSFMGLDNYVDPMFSRFQLRGISGSTEAKGLTSGSGLAGFYLLGYGIVTPALVMSLLRSKKLRRSLVTDPTIMSFLLAGTTICIAHHVIFWGFSNIHDYAVMKSGIIIAIVASLALFTLFKNGWRTVIMVLLILSNITLYYYINRPGAYAANGQLYTYFKSLGEKIKEVSSPDEYIFTDTPEFSLLLTYYSKRFYKNVKDINEAKALFTKYPGNKAVFIKTNNFEYKGHTKLVKQ